MVGMGQEAVQGGEQQPSRLQGHVVSRASAALDATGAAGLAPPGEAKSGHQRPSLPEAGWAGGPTAGGLSPPLSACLPIWRLDGE